MATHVECLCECACGEVFTFAERFAPEREYHLTMCFAMRDAVDQWNQCVAFYRANHAQVLRDAA